MRETRKKAMIMQTIKENYKALHKLHDQEEHIMKHYLCTETRGTNTIHYFIQGKVYSAYQGKEPKYMVFTDEYGDKHPIEIDMLEENFKEVQLANTNKILTVEEYEGMMGQLDQLKHTGQLKQIGHTQVRAMITELYKRQGQ